MKKVSVFERVAKVLMYILIPATVLTCLFGADFLPLPWAAQTRALIGFGAGALLGLGFGIKRKFA